MGEDKIVSIGEGWTNERYDELYKEFEKLSYKEIDELGLVQFVEPIENIDKKEIFDTIVYDHHYEKVKERIESLK